MVGNQEGQSLGGANKLETPTEGQEGAGETYQGTTRETEWGGTGGTD